MYQPKAPTRSSESSTTIKIQVTFKDRVGIIADVSKIISQYDFNIIHMEVIKNKKLTDIYIEMENVTNEQDRDFFIRNFTSIKDFLRIKRIGALPHEEKSNRFTVVLDNISDGVVSIDREGRITTINKVASSAFMKSPAEIVGQKLTKFTPPEYPLLKCLEGKNSKNLKQNFINENGRYQYFSNCRAIHDSHGCVVGAVEIAKDMCEIKQMAQSLTSDSHLCFSDIIGRDSTISEAIAFAEKIAETDICISIYGKSGTGKELFARAIHTASNRKGRFIAINCAALPENLLESELFGYVGGSFTGGKKEGKPGLFEVAEGGTVFLDEIAEMPMVSQAKMLRLIQEKAVRRIGGCKEIPITARIITATNKNLEEQVEQRAFRQDLYYRISVLPIHIPPLNQRKSDIDDLSDHFLFRLSNRLDKTVPTLTPLALKKLHGYDWPGNVRELKNVVERAAILCEEENIELHHIIFNSELNTLTNSRGKKHQTGCSSLKKQVIEFEKEIIQRTFAIKKSIRQTAKALSISHPGLLKKMRKYGMKTVQSRKLS